MPVPPDSFMEQERPTDGEETDEQILDLWMTWPPEEMRYVGLHGAARVAVEEVRRMRAREPLVQEVIDLFREWQRRSGAEAEQTLLYLLAANCKLAEWKP